MSDSLPTEGTPGPKTLTRPQRRVLGVLVEKAITTPNQYPLTLKALTTGCNQSSNRDPVVSYNEEQVEGFLDELRGLGLVACIHTESGRTERFRHYVRKNYPFTEPQLAIIAELWLRGRQQPGELRSRASRMAPIESKDALRTELAALMEQGFVQADGPLDRRGVLVDHAFYPPNEAQRMQQRAAAQPATPSHSADAPDQDARAAPTPNPDETGVLRAQIDRLTTGQTDLATEVEALRDKLEQLTDELTELRRALGA